MEAVPVAGGFASAAVDDQVLGLFGYIGIEIIEEHPERGFLWPAFAGKFETAWSAKGATGGGGVAEGRSDGAQDVLRFREHSSVEVVATAKRNGVRDYCRSPALLDPS